MTLTTPVCCGTPMTVTTDPVVGMKTYSDPFATRYYICATCAAMCIDYTDHREIYPGTRLEPSDEFFLTYPHTTPVGPPTPTTPVGPPTPTTPTRMSALLRTITRWLCGKEHR